MDLVELGLFLKLGAVLMLIVPVLWAVRRLVMPHAGAAQRGLIHLVEIKTLAEGRTLYLVEVGEHHLLLGSSKDSLSLLAELPDLQVPESATTESKENGLFGRKATGLLEKAHARWLIWRRGGLHLEGSWSGKHVGEGAACPGQDA